MKKYLIFIIAATLALALCACGSKTGAGTSAPSDKTAASIQAEYADKDGFEAVDADAPFGQYRSVEELLAILSGEAEDEHANAPYYEAVAPEFGEDEKSAPKDYAGSEYSTTFTDEPWEEGGVEFAKFEDMEGEGAEGSEGTGQSGDWAAYSEYTAGLPAPAGMPQISVEGGVFMAMLTIADASEYDAYLETVKASGFTVDASEEDYSDYGMNMKTFSASHSDGRTMVLTLSETMLAIEIMK